MPARLAIFVAQLGRKFRLFSLTLQRYEIFRCKTIVAGNYFRFISNVKMTNEARAEPNLFELCLARRNSTKSNDGAAKAKSKLAWVLPSRDRIRRSQMRMGTKGQGDKGTFVFWFSLRQNCLLKLLYILLIYILIIYIIIHTRPFADLLRTRLTMQ